MPHMISTRENAQTCGGQTYTHLDKDMERERGRKSYFVHNMRQDVAILCSKSNTIATEARGRNVFVLHNTIAIEVILYVVCFYCFPVSKDKTIPW